MNNNLIEELIKALKKFPGVGEKSAWRYFFTLLNEEESELEHFGDLLIRLKKEVKMSELLIFRVRGKMRILQRSLS